LSLCTVAGEFNKNLAALLAKIFIQRLPQWKLHAADNLGNKIVFFGLFCQICCLFTLLIFCYWITWKMVSLFTFSFYLLPLFAPMDSTHVASNQASTSETF